MSSSTEPYRNPAYEDFFNRFQTVGSRSAARELVKTAYEAGAQPKLGKKSIAIHVRVSLENPTSYHSVGIAWLSYMDIPYWAGCKQFTFGTYPSQRIKFLPWEAWKALGGMYEKIKISEILDAKQVGHESENMVQGWIIKPCCAYRDLGMLKEELSSVIQTFKQVEPALDMHCRESC